MMFVTKKKYNDLLKNYYYQKQIIKSQELENRDLLEQLISLEQENIILKTKKTKNVSQKEKITKTTEKSTKTKNVSQKTSKKKDETKKEKK